MRKLQSCCAFARVAIFIVVISCSVVAQQPGANPLPFERGEELIYQAEIRRGLLRGIDVAEFHFTSTAEHVAKGEEDPVALNLVGDVVSKGFFTKLAGFHFHQHIESTANAQPFTVLRTSRTEEQGKRSRAVEATFDHATRKATWVEHAPNNRTSSIDFSEPVQDVLTAIYFLRTQKLEPGRSFTVPLSDSGRMFMVSVTAREEKELDTAVGRVKTILIEPALFGDDAPLRARGHLSIWLTLDERHLPVRAQLKLDMGTFDIKLKRVTYIDQLAK